MPKRILIVEDESDIREAVQASLRLRGFVVTAAVDGQEKEAGEAPHGRRQSPVSRASHGR